MIKIQPCNKELMNLYFVKLQTFPRYVRKVFERVYLVLFCFVFYLTFFLVVASTLQIFSHIHTYMSSNKKVSFASSSTEVDQLLGLSSSEQYINSLKYTREVGIQIEKSTKDVGTQTYTNDEDTLFSSIEPYKLDEDYMTKMDTKPYGVDYYDDDKVDDVLTDIDLYIASILMQFNQKKN